MEKLQHDIGVRADEELIPKIIEGETALFELLIRRYNSLLYKIARSYGFNHQDAEDLMQETHFSAYTQLKKFRSDASYKTWLTKIHLNKCYHKTHYGSKKYEAVDDEKVNEMIVAMQDNNKQDAEKMIMNKELGKVLEKSLEQLPLIYRNVFIIREMEGFSVAETADLLQITTTNVKVRLNRAKALLQKQLEHYYSSVDIYDFHLKYCDKIVQNVFRRIENEKHNEQGSFEG
jgi:RNA polymerase sigma-70 factor (ECF subfamily)